MEPNQYVQFLENWIPGIGEDTKLHDYLHVHFDLGFSVNDEAKLLGFQLGHHINGNLFHVLAFIILSCTIYPHDYRNSLRDIKDFYKCFQIGKYFQSVPYWFIPSDIFDRFFTT